MINLIIRTTLSMATVKPTNHLDIESIDSLARGLKEFEGAVICISHNIDFLLGFCNSLWCVKDKSVTVQSSTEGVDGTTFEDLFQAYIATLKRD
jgi:ATPase subunit of ABC transporter with duplicated ATPase domains